MRIAVVAIGGNSLIRSGQRGTTKEQKLNLKSTCEGIAAVLKEDYLVVVTHGNGPQVGASLLRSEAAADQVPLQTLDVCVAETQGSIGYLLQQTLQTTLGNIAMSRPVVSIVTQVLVARRDPAFRNPTKPVGPFYTREQADRRSQELGWVMKEDGNRGFRRVVPSPEPKAIIEIQAVQKVLESGALVICCGGGGIPVMLDNVSLVGLEAVIDKDHASSLVASQLGAEFLLISTAVDAVYLNYGTAAQRPLRRLTVEEALRYSDAGQFPRGSMGPKIQAALDFLERGGKKVLITSPERMKEALTGEAGTWLTA